jgi:hypothetical protein
MAISDGELFGINAVRPRSTLYASPFRHLSFRNDGWARLISDVCARFMVQAVLSPSSVSWYMVDGVARNVSTDHQH